MGIKKFTPPPPNKVRLKKDDEVKVIAGRDKGKTGRVLDVNRKNGTVLVGRRVHDQTAPHAPTRRGRSRAESRREESPIAVSNVMALTSGGVPTRVGYRIEGLRRFLSAACALPASRASLWIGKVSFSCRQGIKNSLYEERDSRSDHGVWVQERHGRPQDSKSLRQYHRRLGEATQNPKLMDGAVNELTAIAGQRPVVTKAKKSIAAFKLREGMSIGCMVTLRGDRMYEFLDRLMNVALPRVRDFRGVSSKSFDGRGNYTLGVRDRS